MIQQVLDMISAAIYKEDNEQKKKRRRSSTVNLPHETCIPESEKAKFEDGRGDTKGARLFRKFSEDSDHFCDHLEVPRAVSRHFSQLSISCTASGVADSSVSKRKLDAQALQLSEMLQGTMQMVTKEFEWELYNIRSCLWNTRNSDIYLCVDTSVFPVHKSVLSLHSSVFHDVIFKACKERVPYALPMLKLSGYDVEDIRELLISFYFPNRKLKGETLECVVKLAKTFQANELLRICENSLLIHKPYDIFKLLEVAEVYRFKRLRLQTLREATSVENIHKDTRFSELNEKDRRVIMLNMLKKRLSSVNEALERSKSMDNVNNNNDNDNDEVFSRDRLYSLSEKDNK